MLFRSTFVYSFNTDRFERPNQKVLIMLIFWILLYILTAENGYILQNRKMSSRPKKVLYLNVNLKRAIVHMKWLFRRKYEQDSTRNHPHVGDTYFVKDDYVASEITRPVHIYFSSRCVLRTFLMSLHCRRHHKSWRRVSQTHVQNTDDMILQSVAGRWILLWHS